MRPIQEDMVSTETVSGINDSTYNSFPASPSYMGGFAPTYPVEPEPEPIEPPYFVPNPYEPNPPQYQPLPIEEYNPPYQGYRPPLEPAFPVYEVPVLEQPAKPPYQVYKPPVLEPAFPVYEVPVLEEPANPYNPPYTTDPVIDYPIEVVSPAPIDPIFLTPIAPNEQNYTIEGVSEQILRTTETAATPASETTSETAATTPTKPASETLPTKTSKDLKPYIIAGIAVVGILIASRLFAKK
jgi:hypothetical protein